nr:hypothetical protein L203_01865 [Cryptococcus depauperatus CBS 7841]
MSSAVQNVPVTNTASMPNGESWTGPPPAYTTVVRKVYPYSLRPVVIFVSIVGFIYGLALGVGSIRDISVDGETSKMKVMDLVQAILFFVIALIELYCVVVAAVQNLNLARMFLILAPVGILVNIGVSVLSIVAHFTLKTDLVNQCTTDRIGKPLTDGWDTISNVTMSEAHTICQGSWSRNTWGVFAWLFFTLVLSLIFSSTLFAYYHQLLDPSSIRERRPTLIRQNDSYPMQFEHYPPPPHNGSQPWMVPPYPGPPAGNSSYPPPPQGYEKSDYHPDAEWAQSNYPPPPGAPLSDSNSRGVENREEEEAWERARAEGATAHLTGHAAAPNRNSDERERGYVIPNAEEDMAWERAKNEGVTAHITGHGTGRDREREV